MHRFPKFSRTTAITVCATLLLLCAACSGGTSDAKASETATEMRTKMLAATHFTLTANIRADYGERVYDYTVSFDGAPDDGTITILKPEEVSGVTARLDKGSATLLWDGAAVDTGAIAENISPVAMVTTLIDEWRNGYIESHALAETDSGATLAIRTKLAEGVIETSVFNAETFLPISAEISVGGRVALSATFFDATIT